MTTTSLVTIGRRQYVSGLYWENSPSGRIAQAAREAANQPGSNAEYFAARAGNKNGRVPQFGLTQERTPFPMGAPVLAACLANQQPGSWAGAFRLREGVCVVVVRDDLIVPDGDLFFLGEDEARDRLLQEIALGGLQRIYAPETWGVSGADSLPISLLLNDRTDVRLRPVTIPQQTKLLLAGGVVLLLACLGVGYYIQEENAREEQEAMARMQALERAKAEARRNLPTITKAPEYPAPDRKWEARPAAMDVIGACRNAFAKVELVHNGWRLNSVSCDEKSMVQQWARTGSFSTPPLNAKVTDNGGLATVVLPLEPLKPRGPETLSDQAVVTNRYLAQNWPGTIARLPEDPPPVPPADYKGEWNPPPVPWVKRSFTLSTATLPGQLPSYIGDLSGVVVTSLVLTSTGSRGSWAIGGVIYENRR